MDRVVWLYCHRDMADTYIMEDTAFWSMQAANYQLWPVIYIAEFSSCSFYSQTTINKSGHRCNGGIFEPYVFYFSRIFSVFGPYPGCRVGRGLRPATKYWRRNMVCWTAGRGSDRFSLKAWNLYFTPFAVFKVQPDEQKKNKKKKKATGAREGEIEIKEVHTAIHRTDEQI